MYFGFLLVHVIYSSFTSVFWLDNSLRIVVSIYVIVFLCIAVQSQHGQLWVVLTSLHDNFFEILLHIALRIPCFCALCKFGVNQFIFVDCRWVRLKVRLSKVPSVITFHCLIVYCIWYIVRLVTLSFVYWHSIGRAMLCSPILFRLGDYCMFTPLARLGCAKCAILLHIANRKVWGYTLIPDLSGLACCFSSYPC